MLQITTPTSPDAISRDYSITVNGQTAYPLKTRVSAIPFNRLWPGHQRPIEQSELACYLSLSADEPVTLTVKPSHPFSECVVRPLSKGVTPLVEGNEIRLTLSDVGQYTLEIDGPHHALHIFVDPVRDFGVDRTDARVLYFGAGEHYVGQLDLDDDTTVYIDRDAVVHGSILAVGRRNIRILGYGALDGGWDERKTENFLLAYDYSRVPNGNWELEQMQSRFCGVGDLFPVPSEPYVPGTGSILYQGREHFYRVLDAMRPVKSGIHLYACQNIEINGIILRDSAGLTATQAGCEGIVYDGVKLIGMWRYNSDGIDFYNCRHCAVKNSFLRTFDDTIGIKGQIGWDTENTTDILIDGCVVWNDWGHSLEFGADTVASEICRITFRNCDVIHHAHAVLDIKNMDRAYIHDVSFENIRVEYSRDDSEPQYQHSDDTIYRAEPAMSPLICAILDSNMWSNDRLYGRNEDIRFIDIHVCTDDGMLFPASSLSGYDKEHQTERIRIEGMTHNGNPIRTAEQMNLSIGAFVSDVTIA